jgi:acyl-coenzyme A synthetase/AMP-(fatty) acid ligase
MRQNSSNNIAFAILEATERFADHPAIIAHDVTLSYQKFGRVIDTFVFQMKALGIDRSSVVAVHTTDMIVSLASAFAAALLGARYAAASRFWFEHSPITPTHFLRSPEIDDFPDHSFHLIDSSWSPAVTPVGRSMNLCEGFADPSDHWLFLHSSGTTGAPKYMGLSADLVLQRSVATNDQFSGPEVRLCSMYGCQSRPFYARAMAALKYGCAIVDTVDPTFAQKMGATLVTGSPHHAKQFLGENVSDIKLPEYETAGAKLTPDIADILLRNFETVTEVYGAGETSKSYAQRVVSVTDNEITKSALPAQCDLQIVTQAGAHCGPGETGDVRVRNNYMINGYLGAPELTQKHFREGWFYPGDIGHITPEDELVIAGRTDELINLNGLKFHPKRVDDALCLTADVEAAACFAGTTRENSPTLFAFLEIANGADAAQTVKNAHDACVAKVGALYSPSQVFVVPKIPRTEDGAVRRHLCQQMAREMLHRAH